MLTVVSCGSSQKAAKSVSKNQTEKKEERKPFVEAAKKTVLSTSFNSGLKSFMASGDVSVDMPEMSNSADFDLIVAGNDSLSMVIHGPLGITVAKLYATPSHFIFLNSFSGELYEGTPSRENFRKIANVPLEFQDFLSVLTSRLTYSADKYVLNSGNSEKVQYVYSGKGFTDVAYFPADLSHLHYYARYDQSDSTKNDKVFEIFYSDILKVGDYSFAKNLKLNFPALDGHVEIKYDKVQVNAALDKPFGFKVSKKLKVYNLG